MKKIPERKKLKNRKLELKINSKTKAKKIKYIFLIMFTSIIFVLLYKITFSIILLKKSKNIGNINSNINATSKRNSYNSTKICVCTPVKEENRYIREFEQHYERNIVDKIFIYDNNDITGEKIEDELKDYISKGFVEVLN